MKNEEALTVYCRYSFCFNIYSHAVELNLFQEKTYNYKLGLLLERLLNSCNKH